MAALFCGKKLRAKFKLKIQMCYTPGSKKNKNIKHICCLLK